MCQSLMGWWESRLDAPPGAPRLAPQSATSGRGSCRFSAACIAAAPADYSAKAGLKEDASPIGEHHRTARLLYDQEAERQEHLGHQEALPLSIWPVAMHSFPNSTPGSECLPDPEKTGKIFA